MIAEEELGKLSWAGDLLEAVEAATAIGARSPLLGRTFANVAAWQSWVQPLRESLTFPVYSWLSSPPRVLPVHGEIGDGRHRLTYLRLKLPAEYPVLVCSVQ